MRTKIVKRRMLSLLAMLLFVGALGISFLFLSEKSLDAVTTVFNGAVQRNETAVLLHQLTVSGIRNEEPMLVMDLWHRRLNQSSAFLFLKHIRKAGGTTLRTYLRKVVHYHGYSETTVDLKNTRIRYEDPRNRSLVWYEQEFAAMDWRCPDVDSQWNDTLSVIALRNPIDRHVSEFFYSGGYISRSKDNTSFTRLYLARNFSDEFYLLMETHLQSWIAKGKATTRSNGGLGRYFTDEFQVRALSGETDVLPPVNCNVTGRELPHVCYGPCSYGSVLFGGGTHAWHNVSDLSLERAKSVLDRFDIVLLTETLANDDQAAMLADLLSVPLPVASIAETKMNAWKNAKESADLIEGMKKAIPNTFELLLNYSYYELALYEYALTKNFRLLERWRNEKAATGSSPHFLR